jgi:hypothetical protein
LYSIIDAVKKYSNKVSKITQAIKLVILTTETINSL